MHQEEVNLFMVELHVVGIDQDKMAEHMEEVELKMAEHMEEVDLIVVEESREERETNDQEMGLEVVDEILDQEEIDIKSR